MRITRMLMALVLVVMMPVAAWSAPQNAGAWKINMKKADIRTFIEQVSDITGYSFIVDPRVKGEVTVVSNTEMSSDDIFDMFQSVLRIHGYAAVKTGNVVKIVPTQGAKQEDLPLASGSLGNEKMVTRVIPVENTNATELVPILRPMVPQYGHLAAVSSANALIISDHANNIGRIIEIIKRIDSAESEEVEVVQLKYAWVGDVVKTLEQLTPVETGGAKKSSRSAANVRVRVVAEERTNRLILRGEKSARARVKALVVDLDRPVESTGSTQVMYLRHAEAEKVAEILSALVSGQSATVSRSASSTKRGAAQATATLTTPTATSGDITIQADETLNALIVRAAPADLAEIRNIVDQLDVRRAQVLIEAAFVEVSGTANEALGVQWGYGDPANGLAGTSLAVPGQLSLATIAGLLEGSDGASTDGASFSGLLAGGANQSGDVKMGVVIQAVESNANSNLLSTPSIMTLDNEEAEIIVGENVPFITGTSLSSNNDNPFQTIERQDVGLTLRVTPQINDGNVVRLQLVQEVSNVSNETITGAADISTQKRSVKSVILANDREIIVTGGLVRDDVEEVVNKVPLLGDVPLLGALFRAKSQKMTKRNLLLFLQPTIVRDDTSANRVSQEKYDQMRGLSLIIDQYGNLEREPRSVFPEDARVVLKKGLRFGPPPKPSESGADQDEYESE
ncbi:type II secretion system secretin GspD [Ketobacter sp.]|uniref:type II secretion system secretin GspD n=1 Tax=Ketobacter sp. TaxID=2083498 RepID=UPI0025BFC5CC|nr:type II secretion system secretin GspD [Ketobacter sp.]